MSSRSWSGAATAGGLLVAVAGACPLQAEDRLPGWSLQAPAVGLVDEVVTAREGFVLHTADGWTLVGDALRWDLAAGAVFATGRIALTLPPTTVDGLRSPGLRLEAEHIGLHRPPAGSEQVAIAERGEAWNVQVFLRMGERLMRLRCARAELTREAIILHGLAGDGGHGGLLGLHSSSLVIGLREQPAPDRRGFERHVADLTIWNLRPSLAGIPIFYAPVLYRDFRLDYPWTHYEFGDSSRLGSYARIRTRFDLPPIAGWHLRQNLRLDHYTDTGTPWGARSEWWHQRFGEGEFRYFGFDLEDEEVRRSRDGGVLAHRDNQVLDLAHRVGWPGGAAYARWVDLPAPDPGAGADERFRNDYLEQDLEHRPLARRAVAAAMTWPAASVVLETDHRAQRELDATDRAYALHLSLPATRLLGPLHGHGVAGIEGLEREARADRADRLHYRAGLSAAHWFASGLSLEAEAGVAGLVYLDPELAGIATSDQQRVVPQARANAAFQLLGHFGDYAHRLVPNVGLRLHGEGAGDVLADYAFDPRDDLEEDRQALELGLDTDVSRSRLLFRFTATTLWSLRDEDTPAGRSEADGVGQRLRLAQLEAHGRPIATLGLDGRGRWDGDSRDWSEFDAGFAWTAHPRVLLRGRATWRSTVERWQYRPGATLVGNRYQLAVDLVHEQHAEDLRSISLGLSRRFVDGTLQLGYELERDADGEDLEQSVNLSFSLETFSLY